jgi:hypothetical protein
LAIESNRLDQLADLTQESSDLVRLLAQVPLQRQV